MIGKVLASLGIGSATVDTRLEKSSYRQGDKVQGDVFVKGGKSDQKIDSIYMYLLLHTHFEGKQEEYVLDEILLTDSFTIAAKESRIIPFQFQLPFDTPVTTGDSPIYLKTGLDVKMAVDPDDQDGFEVLPYQLVDQILHAVETIGFRLVDIPFDFDSFHEKHPFVQKFQMEPNGRFAAVLDGLSLIFYPYHQRVDVLMQVDSKAVDLKSSMEEALNMDERYVRFSVAMDESDIPAMIEEHIQACLST